MKTLLKSMVIATALIVAVTGFANPPAGVGGGKGHGSMGHGNVGVVTGVSTVPPGLQNKATPYGLQNKTPPGWSKGNKEGWNKSNVRVVKVPLLPVVTPAIQVPVVTLPVVKD